MDPAFLAQLSAILRGGTFDEFMDLCAREPLAIGELQGMVSTHDGELFEYRQARLRRLMFDKYKHPVVMPSGGVKVLYLDWDCETVKVMRGRLLGALSLVVRMPKEDRLHAMSSFRRLTTEVAELLVPGMPEPLRVDGPLRTWLLERAWETRGQVTDWPALLRARWLWEKRIEPEDESDASAAAFASVELNNLKRAGRDLAQFVNDRVGRTVIRTDHGLLLDWKDTAPAGEP